jgi:hypothetical protein
MTSLVILAAYSASLTYSLTVERRDLIFRETQGILYDDSYRLDVAGNTSTIDILYYTEI